MGAVPCSCLWAAWLLGRAAGACGAHTAHALTQQPRMYLPMHPPMGRAPHAAVFDGHEGEWASDYLARNLHARVMAAHAARPQGAPPGGSSGALADPTLHGDLVAACRDLNAQLTAALRAQGREDGSTAVFALVAGSQLLVANVGNSRAVLCSAPPVHAASGGGGGAAADPETRSSSAGSGGSGSRGALGDDLAPLLVAEQLTSDHTPARSDEAARVVAAGGTVARGSPRGKLRLDGELEVTRAFGDAAFQDRGLIPDPEIVVKDLSGSASSAPRTALLVLASDGVGEALSPEEVCAHAGAAMRGDDAAAPRAPPAAPPLALGGPPGGSGDGSGSDAASADEPRASSGGSGLERQSALISPSAAAEPVASLGVSCGELGTSRAAARAARPGAPPPVCRPNGLPAPYVLGQAAAGRIAEEAYNRGSTDNIAVVVIDLYASAMLAAEAAAERASEAEGELHVPRAVATLPGAGGSSGGSGSGGSCDSGSQGEHEPAGGSQGDDDEAGDGTGDDDGGSVLPLSAALQEAVALGSLDPLSATELLAPPPSCVVVQRRAGDDAATAAARGAGAAQRVAHEGGPFAPLLAAGGGSRLAGGGASRQDGALQLSVGAALFCGLDGGGGGSSAGGQPSNGVGGSRGGSAGALYELTANVLDAPHGRGHVHAWPGALLPVDDVDGCAARWQGQGHPLGWVCDPAACVRTRALVYPCPGQPHALGSARGHPCCRWVPHVCLPARCTQSQCRC